MMLLCMYQIFSSLRSHLQFFVHFFFTLMEYFFVDTPYHITFPQGRASLASMTTVVTPKRNTKRSLLSRYRQNRKLGENHITVPGVPSQVLFKLNNDPLLYRSYQRPPSDIYREIYIICLLQN